MKDLILIKKEVNRKNGKYCYQIIDPETQYVLADRFSNRDYVAALVSCGVNTVTGKEVFSLANCFGRVDLIKTNPLFYGLAKLETLYPVTGKVRMLIDEFKKDGNCRADLWAAGFDLHVTPIEKYLFLQNFNKAE